MLELRKDACQYLLGLVLSQLAIDLDVESRSLSSVVLAQRVGAIGKSFLDQVVFILETQNFHRVKDSVCRVLLLLLKSCIPNVHLAILVKRDHR